MRINLFDQPSNFDWPPEPTHEFKLFIGRKQFGRARAYVADAWESFAEKSIFANMPGGLPFYRTQLEAQVSPPFLMFDDLEVYEEFRGRELGYAGMACILAYHQERGARSAFLRIGTQGENWYVGKIWRQRMYEKLGWQVMAHHPDFRGDVPFMWHPMSDVFRGRLNTDVSCVAVDQLD